MGNNEGSGTKKRKAHTLVKEREEREDKEGELCPFIPFKESLTIGSDPFDYLLKDFQGFISDAVFYLRGTEAPTLYTIWSALFVIAGALKRDCYIPSHPTHLYPNLYIVLLGPAGIGKGISMHLTAEVLDDFHNYIEDNNVRQMKAISTLYDKGSPEAILESLLPFNQKTQDFYFKNPNGSVMLDPETGKPIAQYKRKSELSMVLPELSTLINRQRYMEGLIDYLLRLYDCPPRFDWRIKSDFKVLQNVCLSILGGTTPDKLIESMPRTVLGDGFMSRAVLVYQKYNPREVWEFKRIPGAPKPEDLKKRLAFIAEHNLGEIRLTEEANDYGKKWYHAFKKTLNETEGEQGPISRKRTLLLKLALLMKAARYDDGKLIEIKDIKNAEKLMELTYDQIPEIIAAIERGPDARYMLKIHGYVAKRGESTVREMSKALKVSAGQLYSFLNMLSEDGQVSLWLNGKRLTTTTTDPSMLVKLGDGL